MNNPKNKPPEAGKRTWFYAAIYGCAGLMLALAVALGYRNLSPGTGSGEQARSNAPEAATVGRDTVQSYLTPASPPAAVSQAAPPTIAPKATPAAPRVPTTRATAEPAEPTEPPAQTAPPRSETQSNEQLEPQDYANTEQADDNRDTSVIRRDTQGFSPYDGQASMLWPVLGDVVMDYSVDHVIYDKTLDQYRVNDTLCIAAEAGTPVVASADGIVTKITTTKEKGKTVYIDNGNGWVTTYSQLQDGVLVSVGDVVTQGDTIGGVGTPSIYTILLGNHLGFAVSKDEETMNPIDVLARN